MSIEYVDYYKKNDVEDEIDEIVEDSTVEEEETEVHTVVDESAPTLMGKVDNADRVYVRTNPMRDSEPLTILDKGSEILITGTEEDANGDGWYSVTTASSIDGYILSDFVTIEE